MTKTQLPNAASFNDFSLVCMNANGRYVKPKQDLDDFSDGQEINPDQLPDFLKQNIVLPSGVTDVFVWVHGWRNTHKSALASARRLFHGIDLLAQRSPLRYPRLSPFVPAYLVVRWPSQSNILLNGYKKIRDRAMQLTENGDAQFFLASLLGYLDQKNQRSGEHGSKTLKAAGGFYVHCIGHSFGGRFLTAAVNAAAEPQLRTLTLMNSVSLGGRLVLAASDPQKFKFTVDSMLVLQMAAPCSKFAPQLSKLIQDAPFRGPLVTTFSDSDKANCTWHKRIEGEKGIGCSGTAEPNHDIATIKLAELPYDYTTQDFSKAIVNVDASHIFNESSFMQPQGAHSDFFYEESIHLLLSLVNHMHA